MKNTTLHLFYSMLICCTAALQALPAAAAAADPDDGFLLVVRERGSTAEPAERFITAAEISALPAAEVTTGGTEDDPGRTWTGVCLAEIFSRQGIASGKVEQVLITAGDGYMAVIEGELLEGLQTAFCATGIRGRREFPDQYGYMRLIFPALRAMYWVNRPLRVEVVLGKEQEDAGFVQLYFPSGGRLKEVLEDGTIVAVSDVLAAAGAGAERFNVLAADALLRAYLYNRIIKYMVLQKEVSGTYSMCGINVPAGMKTKNIIFIESGHAHIFLKSLTINERMLWAGRVWDKHRAAHDRPDSCLLKLIKNGTTIRQLRAPAEGNSLYDACLGMMLMLPDFDYIRLEW